MYCKVTGCGAEVDAAVQSRISHMRERHNVCLKDTQSSSVRWYFTANKWAVEFLA